MLVPLTAIVTSSLPVAAALAFCAKDRNTVHAKNKNKSKSEKSGRSSKSSKGAKNSKSHRSGSKSKRSTSRRSKRGDASKKHGKSTKTAKSIKGKRDGSGKKGAVAPGSSSASNSEASVKSSKSSAKSKSSRGSKSSKSSKSRRTRRLDSDAQKKMEKSAKVLAQAPGAAAFGAAPPQSKLASECGGVVASRSLAEEVNAIKHSSQMAVVPARLQYQPIGGVSQLELKNTSAERKAFKLKCSDNALYRVNPVYGIAEPRSSVTIDVLRLNGEEKTDKLVLITASAKGVSDPREAFAKSSPSEHPQMMVVPLVAA
ncbi:unnamed protein product [Caenorhabditis sp. 36 PRJEB53466]|nr:unnamed protein product [Caenorhabditis sp. 36 PRJEB53466]